MPAREEDPEKCRLSFAFLPVERRDLAGCPVLLGTRVAGRPVSRALAGMAAIN
jgi:hypothetical protein